MNDAHYGFRFAYETILISTLETKHKLKQLVERNSSGPSLTSGCTGEFGYGHVVVNFHLALHFWYYQHVAGQDPGTAYHSATKAPRPEVHWVCDSDPRSHTFVIANFSKKYNFNIPIIANLDDVSKTMAVDVRDTSIVRLRSTSLNDTGWPCVGISRQNCHRRKVKRAIKKGETETGKVFGMYKRFIKSRNAAVLNLGEQARCTANNS